MKTCQECGKEITYEEYYSNNRLCKDCNFDIDIENPRRHNKFFYQSLNVEEIELLNDLASQKYKDLKCPKCGSDKRCFLGLRFDGDNVEFEEIECENGHICKIRNSASQISDFDYAKKFGRLP